MTAPVFVDDRLVTGWMRELAKLPAPGVLPENLIQRWRSALLAAVQEAQAPDPSAITGRFDALDRYLIGVAAGLAAGLGTSPASDGGDSDPIILAAGLLAGAASVQAGAMVEDYEVTAGRAAAAAVVDSAANGAGLLAVIESASRAAGQVRSRTLVGLALDALVRSVTPPELESSVRYEVRLLLEPVDLIADLQEIELDRATEGLCTELRWQPDETGYWLTMTSHQPGELIEVVWLFGRVRHLTITYLPD